MLISKAPVRISFGGGGTDLPSYYEEYGGIVLSTTINKYFYSILSKSNNGLIELESYDYQLHQQFENAGKFKLNDALGIPKAVLNHFKIMDKIHLSLKSDIPPGSGLGLSGAVTSSLIQLVSTYRQKVLTKKEIADLSSYIEIEVLKRPIGMQDQYASTFGGFNIIRFEKDSITVEPLKLENNFRDLLEKSLLLFYTGESRNSAKILTGQNEATKSRNSVTISSLNRIKELAFQIRDSLQNEDILQFGRLLHESWEYKRQLSPDISSTNIDKYYQLALENGALGGKITGAGGGGFLLLACEEKHQDRLREVFAEEGLQEIKFKFENEGVHLVLDQFGSFKTTITPEGYLLGISNIVKKLDINQIKQITNIIFDAYRKDKQIFVMGNGGSAATASHFCNDLAKTTTMSGKRGLRVIPLTDNVPLMTAWGNDTGYENIFYGQLYNLLNKDDVVIGISGGGNSPNVIKALKLAKERNAVTIGFAGFQGGKLKNHVNKCIVVPSENYQFIEDIHMVLVHLIVSVLKDRLKTC